MGQGHLKIPLSGDQIEGQTPHPLDRLQSLTALQQLLFIALVTYSLLTQI